MIIRPFRLSRQNGPHIWHGKCDFIVRVVDKKASGDNAHYVGIDCFSLI